MTNHQEKDNPSVGKSTLNELMVKYLIDIASEQEVAELMEHADTETVQEILLSKDLSRRYADYARVDAQKALWKIKKIILIITSFCYKIKRVSTLKYQKYGRKQSKDSN